MKKFILVTMVTFLTSLLFAQWEEQESGTDKTLNQLFFLNDSVGWVVGNSGTLLQTSDGGNNWELHEHDYNESYYNIYFSNASHGWLVGTRYNETDTGKVFHTSDGGGSWEEQFNIDSCKLYDLSFVDSLNGWVLGSTYNSKCVLLKTSDGGINWEYQDADSLIGLYFELQFVDLLNGWIVGDHGDNLWGVIYHTSNGGESWETQGYFDYDFTDLHFIDELKGWVSGKDDNVPTQGGVILRTDDGGITWEETTTDYGLRGVHFTDENNGWTVSGYGYIYYSDDGGVTLELQYDHNSSLMSVFFSDDQNGWTIGGSDILHTVNGGTVGIEEPSVHESKHLQIHSYPNPFSTTTTIQYELTQPETVTITFYNQFGKQVDIIRHDQSQGLNKVVWTPENLVNGVYYFRLEAGEIVANGKVVLVR